jgi:hypothetical protein
MPPGDQSSRWVRLATPNTGYHWRVLTVQSKSVSNDETFIRSSFPVHFDFVQWALKFVNAQTQRTL